MIQEHDVLLKTLGTRSVECNSQEKPLTRTQEELLRLAVTLTGAELHHLRKTLFPELERRGISGPPTVMRLSTMISVRKSTSWKFWLGKLWRWIRKGSDTIAALSRHIIFNLRDHIFKENHILYPAAVETITKEVWSKIEEECDKIGYTPFTKGK